MEEFCRVGVLDDRLAEEGYILCPACRLRRRSLEKANVDVKDAKGPATFIGALPGVNLSQIEYDNVSTRCHVICTAIPKTLRSIFNDTYRHAFMSMTRKGVPHVLGMKQFDVIDVPGAPKLCFLLSVNDHRSCAPYSLPWFLKPGSVSSWRHLLDTAFGVIPPSTSTFPMRNRRVRIEESWLLSSNLPIPPRPAMRSLASPLQSI